MKTLKIIFALLMIVNFGANAQTAQNSNHTEYKKALVEMLEITGSNASFKMMLEQMIPVFQQQNKAITEEAMEMVKSKFVQSSISELIELSTPIYQEHLELQDLKDVIEFYKTPAGKKYGEKNPLIAKESMQVSQQWAASLPYKFKQIVNDVAK
jgi:hypothetical protein